MAVAIAGDLTVVIRTRPGDRTSLMAAMKTMRDALAGIVGDVRAGTGTIARASVRSRPVTWTCPAARRSKPPRSSRPRRRWKN